MENHTKKTVRQWILWIVLGLVMIILSSFLIKNVMSINHTSRQQVRNYVKEVVSQIRKNINTQMYASEEELLLIKNTVFSLAEDEQLTFLENRESDSGFTSFLIFDDLTATADWLETTYGIIDELDTTLLRNNQVQILAIPHEDKVVSIVTETDYTDSRVLVGISTDSELVNLLLNNTADSKWEIYPVTNEGVVITEPSNITIDELFQNQYGLSDSDLSDLKKHIENKETTWLNFEDSNGDRQVLYYVPLDHADWYVAIVVPYAKVSTGISLLTTQNMVITIIGLIICLGIMLYLLWVKRKTAKDLSSVAFMDKVVNAKNNTYFQMEVQQLLKNYKTSYYLVSMDICDFKVINNVYGLEVGNKTLRYVYKQIKELLGEDERIARGSADIFYMLLKGKNAKAIVTRLHQIYHNINTFSLGKENVYYLELRFGIYMIHDRKISVEEMEECANIARKSNQREEKFSYAFYDVSYLKKQLEEKALVNAMSSSLKAGHFEVYLQPKVLLQEHKVIGAEALIRWHHPEQGMLSPAIFIPVFERHRVIHHLDKFVFEEVCRLLARWKQEGKELCIISINLSRQNLDNPNFLKEYYEICQSYGVLAKYIEIELTETIFMENLERVQSFIDEMHQYGFLCSLDDFGVGYSSLGMLKDLDIDVIKLDRSFFVGKNNSSKRMLIVETILRLASQMHMQTVAEGIDTQEQAEALRALGCDMIQGFIYYRPMPIAEFESVAFEDHQLKYLPLEVNSQTKKPQQYVKEQIISFTYLPDKDSVVFSDAFSNVLKDQVANHNAQQLFYQSALICKHDVENFKQLVQKSLVSHTWEKDMIRFQFEDGYYDWVNVYLICDEQKEETTLFGVIVNFKAVREELELWRDKAYRDSLTNLYNRSFLEMEIEKMFYKEKMNAMVCIDVDDFKDFNVAYGHMIGDQLLQQIAQNLLEVFRNQDIIARYGGDEFIVFLPKVKKEVLQERLQYIIDSLKQSYEIEGKMYAASVSIGAVWYYQQYVSYKRLLCDMEQALTEAKKKGKAQLCIQEVIKDGPLSL